MSTNALFAETQWGDVATWAGAVFTGSAIGVALWQIARERRQREKADAQALVLDERAHAIKVSAWYSDSLDNTDGGGWLMVLNASDLPVYRVVLTFVFVQGAAPHNGEEMARLIHESGYDVQDHMQGVFVVPPGTWRVPISGGWAGMHRRPSAEVAFVDAGGVPWVRRATGSLEKSPREPFDYFKLSQPISGGYAERVPH